MTDKEFHHLYILPAKDIKPGMLSYHIEFFNELSLIISAHTELNYHRIRAKNQAIIAIPIYRYTHEEYNLSDEKLAQKKLDILKKFFREYDFKNTSNIFKSVFYNIYRANNDSLVDLLRIKVPLLKYDKPITIKNIAFEIPSIERHKLVDGSKITVLTLPYAKEGALLLADQSRRFSDYNYQYNLLHLYEHLTTYAWKDLDHSQDIINGITTLNGISNVYAIVEEPSKIYEYMYSYISFITKSRDIAFWEKNKDIVKVETQRTTSETLNSRSYTTTARADPSAFSFSYNTEIFCKWSQEPLNLLLVCREKMSVDVDRCNSLLLSTKSSQIVLRKPLFSHIPVETIVSKEEIRVLPFEPEQVLTFLWKNNGNEFPGLLFGVDSVLVFPVDYTITMNYDIYKLLYLPKFCKKRLPDDELAKTIHAFYDFRYFV